MKWFRKKVEIAQENPVVTPPEPPSPTRAKQLVGLFQYRQRPFVWEGLHGEKVFLNKEENPHGWHNRIITITHNDKSVLWIEQNYMAMGFGRNWTNPRTIIYDESYSDQLDAFISALGVEVNMQKRQKQWIEERTRERKECELTRF